MEVSGSTVIRAPRDKVWTALNDPEVLARCIEGVDRLERTAENRFEGRMKARVGDVRATFSGTVLVTGIDAPNGYVIVGEGKGGAAGFFNGSADIRLSELASGSAPTVTTLSYVARSSVGGKLAQLDGRLVAGAARSYADSFFRRLKGEVEGGSVAHAGRAAVLGAQADLPFDSDDTASVESDGGNGDAVASAAMAELQPTISPSSAPPPPGPVRMAGAFGEMGDRSGLSPLVWGGLVVLATIAFVALLLS